MKKIVIKNEYLYWMSEETESQWCNDSANIIDIESALESRAMGCTTNPPLSYETLTKTPEIFQSEVEKIPESAAGNDRVVELIGVVVRHISNMLYEIYEKTAGSCGYVRAQVQPDLFADAQAMLAMGKHYSTWGKNVMVKIPGTQAGIWVLEELAALGIPTNPTVCVSVSQIVAAAEAYERGSARAAQAGIAPAPSTGAFVMGRLQDYLSKLNDERKCGLTAYDLECAALAVAKRCYTISRDRGYKQVLMPAAFRSANQVAQMAGGKVVMTIHPTYQAAVMEADSKGLIRRESAIDQPVDEKAIERVLSALPEFNAAYDPNGLAIKDFDGFGATAMTLDGFNTTGWQRLLTL